MAITGIRCVSCGSEEGDRALAFAYRELARYIQRITGREWGSSVPAREESNITWLGIVDQFPLPKEIDLQPSEWDDGFAIWADDQNRLFIAGSNPRSVVFGVYAYLEQQGVKFIRPGDDGEVIPHLKELSMPQEVVVEKPTYRHRGVCIERALSVEHALGMIDWCAKNRMNTVFLQFFSSQYFYNKWYEREYNPEFSDHVVSEEEALALDDRVIAAMKSRGMVFHRVGHSWTSAAFDMPRSGWVTADDDEIPEEYRRYLAEVDGERKLFKGIPINTEICYSHEPAFERFIENIVKYCENHPEMDVVHVWLSDATNNKCECAGCRELNISDWYAKVINELSKRLAERAPGKRFVFLCYFELLWPPEKVKIDESYGNAIMMFAPISRCYAHALTDPDCDDGQEWPRPELNQFAVSRNNAFFVKQLAEWREAFGGDSFDFDYHLMWAVWHQLTDTLVARVIYEDLQDLKERGLDGIISCQSFRNFYPSGLAMAALAEGLWDPSVPFAEVRRSYMESAFGSDASFADDYFTRMESYLDPGDPHWRDLPLSKLDGATLAEIAQYLDGILAKVEKKQARADGDVSRRSLAILAHHAQLVQHLVNAYQEKAAGKGALANLELNRAADFLRRTEPDFSTYIDTFWALPLSVNAHRQEESA